MTFGEGTHNSWHQIEERHSTIIGMLDRLEEGTAPADFAEWLLDGGPVHTPPGLQVVQADIKGDGVFWIASVRIGTKNKVGVGTVSVVAKGRERRERRLRATYDIEAAVHFNEYRASLLDRPSTPYERALIQRVESLLCLAAMAMGRGHDRAVRMILQATADLIEAWRRGEPVEPLEP